MNYIEPYPGVLWRIDEYLKALGGCPGECKNRGIKCADCSSGEHFIPERGWEIHVSHPIKRNLNIQVRVSRFKED